jgi:hypothetical protein
MDWYDDVYALRETPKNPPPPPQPPTKAWHVEEEIMLPIVQKPAATRHIPGKLKRTRTTSRQQNASASTPTAASTPGIAIRGVTESDDESDSCLLTPGPDTRNLDNDSSSSSDEDTPAMSRQQAMAYRTPVRTQQLANMPTIQQISKQKEHNQHFKSAPGQLKRVLRTEESDESDDETAQPPRQQSSTQSTFAQTKVSPLFAGGETHSLGNTAMNLATVENDDTAIASERRQTNTSSSLDAVAIITNEGQSVTVVLDQPPTADDVVEASASAFIQQVSKPDNSRENGSLNIAPSIPTSHQKRRTSHGPQNNAATPRTHNKVFDQQKHQSKDNDSDSERADASLFPPFLPRQVECRSEFDVDSALLLPTWKSEGPFDARNNRYGIFHLRVLRAQRLPCSVGSAIQAVVSLKPWKGKVKTTKTSTFPGTLDAYGVCARWEDEGNLLSVTHAYSGEDSVLPTLHVEIVFSPLGLGLFDFSMCSVDLSCAELMQFPVRIHQQWFTTTLADSQASIEGVYEKPLVELEAMFEPIGVHTFENEDVKGISIPVSTDDNFTPPGLDVEAIDFSVASSSNFKVMKMADERTHSDVSISMNSSFKGEGKAAMTTPHLLRVKTYRRPAVCCVCNKSIMSSFRTVKAFRCEVCEVDCCSDCQLQVDSQLPCGSYSAIKAKDNAIQNRLTVGNIMKVVAPDESFSKLRDESIHNGLHTSSLESVESQVVSVTEDAEIGIGSMKFKFVRACVFSESLPADGDASSMLDKMDLGVKTGDYYVRVCWNVDTRTIRTRTVQSSGRPRFDTGELFFNVPHYGAEFRIELVDSATDTSVGSALITTQSMLQLQRDSFARKCVLPLGSLFHGPKAIVAQEHLVIELRKMNGGFSSEFFAPSRLTDKTSRGEITGCIELFAGMEEQTKSLFGSEPYGCPSRPPEELNMAIFQLHIARLSSLIEDAKRLIECYQYIVSWRHPILTALSMLVFIQCCIRFNPVYFGSLPFLFLFLLMVHFSFARNGERLKEKFLRKEVEAYRQAEQATVDYSLHRPIGLVTITVRSGRNLRSPELGLPGKVGCRVYWDPVRFLKPKKRENFFKLDKAAKTSHDIAATEYQLSVSPKWDRMRMSSGLKRLNQMLPNKSDGTFFSLKANGSSEGIKFPVLQPLMLTSDEILCLCPWTNSVAAIVVEVKFKDALSFLPDSEYSLGEVVIPISRLAETGSISGWFKVDSVGTTQETILNPDAKGNDEDPQLFASLKWMPPVNDADSETAIDREASIVIQEELLRSSIIEKEQKKGLIGTSLGAINTVRGISDHLLFVQNTLGVILDVIGVIRSAFNFSDPYKSSVIFVLIIIAWMFFALVPTQALFLVGGVLQYAITFKSRFGRFFNARTSPTNDTLRSSVREEDVGSSQYTTWIMNAVRGLPTDEDIRKTYYWESLRRRARLMEAKAEEKRSARLTRLWRAQWYSTIQVLTPTELDGFAKKKAFAIIQGHRFLWWPSVLAFDHGDAPAGCIFLAGHAGLTTPSPLEIRTITASDLHLLTGIFGKGLDKQEKITIITPQLTVKEQLEKAVEFAISSKKD